MNRHPITLVAVSSIAVAPNGDPYFLASFHQGRLGRPILRALWGSYDDEGGIVWEHIGPEDLAALKGGDLSGRLLIEAVAVTPEAIVVPWSGEVERVTRRRVVRFAGEPLAQAVRCSGSTLRRPDEGPAERIPVEFVSATSLPGDCR